MIVSSLDVMATSEKKKKNCVEQQYFMVLLVAYVGSLTSLFTLVHDLLLRGRWETVRRIVRHKSTINNSC